MGSHFYNVTSRTFTSIKENIAELTNSYLDLYPQWIFLKAEAKRNAKYHTMLFKRTFELAVSVYV